jgi:hypothetical protein
LTRQGITVVEGAGNGVEVMDRNNKWPTKRV